MLASRPLWIRLVAAGGVTCISFAAIFFRAAAVDPAGAAFWRAVYALPLLALIWIAVRHRDGRDTRARLLAVAAGVLLSIDLTLWHYAIEDIGAGLATVLVNTQVLFVGIGAWLVLKERPSRAALWTVPVVLAGVAMLSGLGLSDAYGDDPVAGVVLGVGSGVAYAAFLLVFRESNRRHLAPTPGPLLDATVGLAAGALMFGVLLSDISFRPEWPAHGWLLAAAVLVQIVGWMAIAAALPRLPALETSVLILLQPVGALLWSRLIYDETLSVVQGMGVLVVLAGVLTASVLGTVARRTEEAALPVEA